MTREKLQTDKTGTQQLNIVLQMQNTDRSQTSCRIQEITICVCVCIEEALLFFLFYGGVSASGYECQLVALTVD